VLAPPRFGQTATVTTDAAELSALASTIEDLERRILSIADRYASSDREEVLAALFGADRHLRQAERSLETARRALAR